MSSTVARYSEADDLRDRIVEAELQHANAVRLWEAEAAPIRERMRLADEDYDATGHPGYAQRLQRARDELEALKLTRPVEPLRLGMLRGRLARLEDRQPYEPRTLGSEASGEERRAEPTAPSPAHPVSR